MKQLFGLFFLYGSFVLAAPNESVVNWGILKNTNDTHYEFNLVNTQSNWSRPYSFAELIFSIGREQWFTAGYKSSFATEENQRNAWFIRHDIVVGDKNSFSFKYIHENWYFLDSGKESIGLAFNSVIDLGIYYSFGYYYRWLKQSWVSGHYAPFSFQTDDHHGFFIAVLGIKVETTAGNFWTLDVNNRDNFSYFGSDNWALDYKYYFSSSSDVIWNLLAGIRFTGISGLTPYPATAYVGIGSHF